MAGGAFQQGVGMDSDELSGSSDDRTWGALAHLSALLGIIIPFGHLIGPLAVWLFKRNDSEVVGAEAKEALNFQITITIALILCIPAMFIGIGGVLFIVFLIADLIFIIKAAIHASKGDEYSYPWAVRMIG
jgi:uncharacterized Tic20 family protein